MIELLEGNAPTIEVLDRDANVLELIRRETTTLEIISEGPQGPQGPQGPSGVGAVVIDVLAAEDLPAFTMTTVQGNIADSNNIAHYGRVAGITIEDVPSGFIAHLQAEGDVTNPSWSWSPSTTLFLNGTTISATPPASGFSQLVAVARNAVIVIMGLEPPILL